MSFLKSVVGPCILILVCGLGGCRAKKEGAAAPFLEETSTTFLATEAGDALTYLQDAKQQLPDHPADAAQSLDRVEKSLSRLLGYYLPLLEARERAHNAYRFYNLGERDSAARELDLIEEKLLGVAKSQGETVALEIKEPLETLEGARVAMTGAPEEVPATLEALARRLNQMLEKGRIFLP